MGENRPSFEWVRAWPERRNVTSLKRIRTKVFIGFVCLVSLAGGGRASGQQASTLQSITVGARDDQVVVTISVSGSALDPAAGIALTPPRIYLDFKDVAPKGPIVTKGGDH